MPVLLTLYCLPRRGQRKLGVSSRLQVCQVQLCFMGHAMVIEAIEVDNKMD